jgi:hypothetical protein
VFERLNNKANLTMRKAYGFVTASVTRGIHRLRTAIDYLPHFPAAVLLTTILVSGCAQQAWATVIPVPSVTLEVGAEKFPGTYKTQVFLLHLTPLGPILEPFQTFDIPGGTTAVFNVPLQDFGFEVDPGTKALLGFNFSIGVVMCQTYDDILTGVTRTDCQMVIARRWVPPVEFREDLPDPFGPFIAQRDGAGALSFPDLGLDTSGNVGFVLIDAAAWLAGGASMPQPGQSFDFVNGISQQLPGVEVGLSALVLDPDAGVSNPHPFTGTAHAIGAIHIRAIPEPSGLLLLFIGVLVMHWARGPKRLPVGIKINRVVVSCTGFRGQLFKHQRRVVQTRRETRSRAADAGAVDCRTPR